MTEDSPPLRPFEVDAEYLENHLDEMVSTVFVDLESQFLVMPKGRHFVEYQDFQDAYEVLKRHTSAFTELTDSTVWAALKEDALVLVVLRTILGVSPGEWVDLAKADRGTAITESYARGLDGGSRANRELFRHRSVRSALRTSRTEALISVAVEAINRGSPAAAVDTVHRLAKFDTIEGLASVRNAASLHVPYAVLLYERFLGRPFATHRDSVSRFVGDAVESAIEERLARERISYRKTRQAERVPGFDQAPDLIVPDEVNPVVVIEAKLVSDDGTARDKATRIIHLAELRDERIRQGQRGFEVVACIDGRGFGVRRELMRSILRSTRGKVFTLSTLDQLIAHTRLKDFLPAPEVADGEVIDLPDQNDT